MMAAMTYDQALRFVDRVWPTAGPARSWHILRVSRRPEVFTVTAQHVGGLLHGDPVRRAPVHSFTGDGKVSCHPACARRARTLVRPAAVLPFVRALKR